jgi:hypothetical protein
MTRPGSKDEAIREQLLRNPHASNRWIADLVQCDEKTVRQKRLQLSLVTQPPDAEWIGYDLAVLVTRAIDRYRKLYGGVVTIDAAFLAEAQAHEDCRAWAHLHGVYPAGGARRGTLRAHRHLL